MLEHRLKRWRTWFGHRLKTQVERPKQNEASLWKAKEGKVLKQIIVKADAILVICIDSEEVKVNEWKPQPTSDQEIESYSEVKI